MRGRNKKMQGMKLGRTIVAERERAESDSERMMARKKAHRKQRTSVVIVLLMGAVLALTLYVGVNELNERRNETDEVVEVVIKAQLVDEDNRGRISARTKTYIAQLEKDLRDLGYNMTKVTLPTGMSRELYVDLEGKDGYFKVSLDRETAVTAEDIDRMLRYLEKNGVVPEYVDVRLEGKAYYKQSNVVEAPSTELDV